MKDPVYHNKDLTVKNKYLKRKKKKEDWNTQIVVASEFEYPFYVFPLRNLDQDGMCYTTEASDGWIHLKPDFQVTRPIQH